LKFAGIVSVTIGFAIWDRRTALAPAIQRARELEEKENRLEKAMRKLADEEPRFASALKYAGLM
jgi:translation elongation factor EF-G